jgi:hypothetical protein
LTKITNREVCENFEQAKFALTLVQKWLKKIEVIDLHNKKNSKNHYVRNLKGTLKLSFKFYNKILVIALMNLIVQVESKIQDLLLLFVHQFQNYPPNGTLQWFLSNCRFQKHSPSFRAGLRMYYTFHFSQGVQRVPKECNGMDVVGEKRKYHNSTTLGHAAQSGICKPHRNPRMGKSHWQGDRTPYR